MVVGFCKEREREREVLKLGLPKSSFVCFCLFRKEIQQGSMLSHTFKLLGRQLIGPPLPMIWLQNSSDMYECPAKGHMTIKSVSSFLIASFFGACKLVIFLWPKSPFCNQPCQGQVRAGM